ncbi:MAG: hypothetical protein JWM87_4404 [Candidatus Eremiobacteraeota bacterium]|nr:hypothetical protein [Candidatus Eremiobacteraeota bacterium]
MPIIYVHGVAIRDESAFAGISLFLRHYVAPKLNKAYPESVGIYPAFWWNDAATFAWDGASRPRTALLHKGADQSSTPGDRAAMLAPFARILQDLPKRPTSISNDIRSMGPRQHFDVAPDTFIAALSRDDKVDLLALMLSAGHATDLDHPIPIGSDLARTIIATDENLSDDADTADELARVVPEPPENVLAKGSARFITLRDRLLEAAARVGDAPGSAVTRALEELRIPLNDFVTRFLGDIFVYLANRGGSCYGNIDEPPGLISRRVLDVIAKAQAKTPGEPTIVVTHSMGGQIVYDIVTRFMPDYDEYSTLKPIDLWCASASQVGLFEELKLFIMSDRAIRSPAQVPHPNTRGKLDRWLNVWDRSDIISYTGRPIFKSLENDDREYSSGASVLNAHGAYLVRPSFYKMVASAI